MNQTSVLESNQQGMPGMPHHGTNVGAGMGMAPAMPQHGAPQGMPAFAMTQGGMPQPQPQQPGMPNNQGMPPQQQSGMPQHTNPNMPQHNPNMPQHNPNMQQHNPNMPHPSAPMPHPGAAAPQFGMGNPNNMPQPGQAPYGAPQPGMPPFAMGNGPASHPGAAPGYPQPGQNPAFARPGMGHPQALQQGAQDEEEEQNPVKRAIARIKGNKIVLGLIIVCMLGIFVGGIFMPDEPKKAGESAPTAAPTAATAPAEQAAAPAPAALSPSLATDFVKWWLSTSMDYNPQSAQASHKQAFGYATPEAASAFQSCFWTPAISSEILSGRVSAAFQPVSVVAEAVNPDGTVVIGMSGTLMMQSQGSTPVTEQLAADFLVKQEKEGLRVCAFNNRSQQSQAAAAPVAQAQPAMMPSPNAYASAYQPRMAPMLAPSAAALGGGGFAPIARSSADAGLVPPPPGMPRY